MVACADTEVWTLAQFDTNNGAALQTLITKHKVEVIKFPDKVLDALRPLIRTFFIPFHCNIFPADGIVEQKKLRPEDKKMMKLFISGIRLTSNQTILIYIETN